MSLHLRSRCGRVPTLVVALIAVAVCGAALTVAHRSPRVSLPRAAAVHAALASPRGRTVLAATHWTQVTVTPVDGRLTRVSFFAGARIVAEMAVTARGHVTQTVTYTQLPVPYGDWIAYQPALLIGLGVLFVLATGVAPLRRLRNLDVAAALSLLAPAVLLQQRYLDASVLAAVPGLAWLLGRCAWRGLHDGPSAPPRSTPLLIALTPRLEAARRARVLRLVVLALALVFVMVGVTTPIGVDVAYAVMEGATKLIHGVLPYGHLPGDIVHGDTYPLLSYALYTPLALVAPVSGVYSA